MVVTGTKNDDKRALLAQEQSQDDVEVPPSYSAANAVPGPSAGMSYAQAARANTAHSQSIPSAPAQAGYATAPPQQYAQYSATPPHTPFAYTYTPAPPPPHGPPSEPAWKRFFKALGVAVLIWVLFGMLTESVGNWGLNRLVNRIGRPTSPGRGDGTVQTCFPHGNDSSTEWTDQPVNGVRSRRATLDLDLRPAHDAVLFLLTRGNTASGSVNLVEGDGGDNSKATIVVEYDPYISSDHALWQVCTLERPVGSKTAHGFGVYFPDYVRGGGRWHRFDVTVTVTLPKTFVRAFKTDTKNYRHVVDLNKETSFDALVLSGTNGRVEIKSPIVASSIVIGSTNARIDISSPLVADSIEVETTNGHIETPSSITADAARITSTNGRITGSFNVTSLLALRTKNGAITTPYIIFGSTSTDLTSAGRRPRRAGALTLETDNAAITVDALRLVAPESSSPSDPPLFKPTFTTSNGPLALAVAALPPRALLVLAARTSNNRAALVLPATFEGAIAQRTSNAGLPDLAVPVDAEDPLGRGRKYVVQNVQSDKKGSREDRVGWDGAGQGGYGKVDLQTSNGKCGVRIVPGWE